ncbi:AraC family transcriptional regulator [Luteimonas sp. BDR2-5]|uniref:helix-turn-helix domain-containing protein n=1 Tax=Proluteimonas luteida TaxID=2878685 RepID=UPI001E5FAC48|nr:AraC family transcriptional regulator [Luteimonas sp. BDR2-5]MCD9027852.1 AraC family transcriptional regulator [Luteimonas sp. BDR2-5]
MTSIHGTGRAVAGGTPAPMAHQDNPRVTRILRCIEEHLEDPALDCDFLQRLFFVSRPTLYRMFQPLGGVSRYIRERRLVAARRRLREEPHHSITWLLYDLGFESERQFQRAFQARFGMSPASWRARCRGEERPKAGMRRAPGASH